MSNLATLTVQGWDLRIGSDGEPTVLDLDLAKHLGYPRPTNIRRLIERLRIDGKLKDSALFYEREQSRGGRPGMACWLTEAAALKVIAKSETALADAMLDEMIEVFIKARRGLLVPPVAQKPTLELSFVNGPRVGEIPNLRADVASECAMAARASNNSVKAIHGAVRKTFRVPGVYQISTYLWPHVREFLHSVGLGRLVLARKARALPPADPRQTSFL